MLTDEKIAIADLFEELWERDVYKDEDCGWSLMTQAMLRMMKEAFYDSITRYEKDDGKIGGEIFRAVCKEIAETEIDIRVKLRRDFFP